MTNVTTTKIGYQNYLQHWSYNPIFLTRFETRSHKLKLQEMNKKPVSKLRQQMAENFTTQLNALKTSLSTKINEKPSFVQALIAWLV